jgi:hypothetical protein
MVLFWTIFKKRVFFLYMFVCLAGTMIIAYTFQFFVFARGVDTGNDLIRGVSSISGGASAVISKTSSHVRMVLDPTGKGLIATYRNDLGGQGGAVFDAGYGRFTGSVDGSDEHGRYLVNVAKWLEDNSSSPDGSSILIYDLSSPERTTLGDRLLAGLSESGFRVKSVGKKEMASLTDKCLAGYGQLWLFSAGPSRLTDAEHAAVSKFSGEGKGLFLVGGADPAIANRLSGEYGVVFSESVEQRADVAVGIASRMFGGASELLGRFLKLVHKA